MDAKVKTLVKSKPHAFTNLMNWCKKNYPDIDHTKLLRKGVFPYSYITSPDVLMERQLPGIEHFTDDLVKDPNNPNVKSGKCNFDDYKYAQEMWDLFSCKTLRDYHDLYLSTDVLLLADVFVDFRNMCLETYKLDPLHYYGAPLFAWDAMLKNTGV